MNNFMIDKNKDKISKIKKVDKITYTASALVPVGILSLLYVFQ